MVQGNESTGSMYGNSDYTIIHAFSVRLVNFLTHDYQLEFLVRVCFHTTTWIQIIKLIGIIYIEINHGFRVQIQPRILISLLYDNLKDLYRKVMIMMLIQRNHLKNRKTFFFL